MGSSNGKIYKEDPGRGPYSVYGASFSADGKKLISFTYKQPLVRLWNYKTGLLISDLSDHNDPVYFGEFFPDGKTVVTADDITFRLWDAETGKALKQYFYDRGQISGVCFNNETVLFKDNAELKVYNIRSGQQLYSLLCIDSLDYICITKAGYYKSTTGASKLLHYVTKDLKVITFEQLDVKYNRPDKVLEAIGNTDTTLIKSYRKAWEKGSRNSALIQHHSGMATAYPKQILPTGMLLNTNKNRNTQTAY